MRRCPRQVWRATLVCAALALSGCAYYVMPDGSAVPAYGSVPVSGFERSWSAASGAMLDEGVAVTYEDRSGGVIQGTRDGITVTSNVRTQADGSVRVQFDARGATTRDPSLLDRISQRYDRRMGR